LSGAARDIREQLSIDREHVPTSSTVRAKIGSSGARTIVRG